MARPRSTVVPFRRRRRTRASNYRAGAKRAGGWFSAIMVALPLAAFTAVFVWDGPPQASGAVASAIEGEAKLPPGWDTRPEDLDGQQPESGLAVSRAPFAPGADRERARFGLCNGLGRGGGDCVIDGDTFWYRGEKVRIADINTPETSRPGCAREAELGAAATERLQALLNEGAFTLEPIDRDRDKYGRALRTVTRDGASLGAVLVSEGLAEEWQGYRREWC